MKKIYKSDIQIAQEVKMRKMKDIVNELHIHEDEWEPYGHYKAKVSLDVLERHKDKENGKLVLVTSINPTPAGEGKSTVTVGLGQALNQIGKKAIIALREPSLGPTMGLKGGAAGGGYSQVVPMEDINLHFTGDLHAITCTHNTLAALLDNHLHQGNELQIDPRRIVWKRVLDINDRALRQITIGLGGPLNSIPREDGFMITVASEIMAILCLATDMSDLKERLRNMLIAYTYRNEPIYVKDLGAEGALAALLKDALKPNLVQTLEGTPAFVHGGPFANIAHGCNSILATRMALKLGEYTVTEAGFGADLGAEKFLHIKVKELGKAPDVVVIVATIRALKQHGGVRRDELQMENVEALQKGLENLEKHIETIHAFGLPVVVAMNRFVTDSENEIATLQAFCECKGVSVALAEVWEHGGKGGIELAHKVVEAVEQQCTHSFSPLYKEADSLEKKIETIATTVYGASGVTFSTKAKKQLVTFTEMGLQNLPICMSKTQYSLSDVPTRLGRPTHFTIEVTELRANVGAGFIVAMLGNILTMPGLPKQPAALRIDVDEKGVIEGLF